MKQFNDESVKRYLKLFPDEADLLRNVLVIGEKQHLAEHVQSLLDECLAFEMRGDWDSIIVHDLNPKVRNFLDQPPPHRSDKRGKTHWA
mgnify:CR=1 FL=1